MSESNRVLRLVNQAMTAVITGNDTALDKLMSSLDDQDLEALIAHMTKGFDVQVRFVSPGTSTEERS
ncbi:hypothetical protein D7D52_22135 [Nocardia yunnanensis]|uniref:Uncharacterized protein n=1 Tax=Nocardia yunnanensis TaxID=2382165 RepID=A0A386ZF10_9NOCA|nr:hypothetical protein [Nocardia yunnanensis]AYF76090.1 hypothetical protein D7D52_22135 [Nocardia yunnanensis]